MDHEMVRDKQSFWKLSGSLCLLTCLLNLSDSPALRRFFGWLHRTIRAWPAERTSDPLESLAKQIDAFGKPLESSKLVGLDWTFKSISSVCREKVLQVELAVLYWWAVAQQFLAQFLVRLQAQSPFAGDSSRIRQSLSESLSSEDKEPPLLSAMTAFGMTKNVDPDFAMIHKHLFVRLTIVHRRAISDKKNCSYKSDALSVLIFQVGWQGNLRRTIRLTVFEQDK